MSPLPLLLVLFLSLYNGSTHAVKDIPAQTLTWPNTRYHLKGEEIDLKSGLETPFEIWSSKFDPWVYRRDYYGGVESEYYDFDANSTYNIFPMTNKDMLNVYKCVEMELPEDEKLKEDMFLPDLSDANFTGTTTFEDREVQIWELEEIFDNSKMTIKAYVSKHNTYSVPVQITKIVYNTNKGNVQSHIVTNYYGFSEQYDMNSLKVKSDLTCEKEESFWQKYPDMNKLDPNKQSHVHLAFRRFMSQHQRLYDKDEINKRKAIFHENWKMVVEHNSQNLSYKLEMNKYADRTPEELGFLAATTWSSDSLSEALPFPYTEEELLQMIPDLPEEYDLYLEGKISRVKNQGRCGSCWAFATVGAVEGALAFWRGWRELDLSEQSIIDCGWISKTYGCRGGDIGNALNYVVRYGLPTEADYGPYMAKNGRCHYSSMSLVYKITGYGRVLPRIPAAMKVALNRFGPVLVSMCATRKLMLYSSGVFYDPSCVRAVKNHAVVIVGYGIRDGELYWIVKNSWGEDWGQDGFFLLSAHRINCLWLNTALYLVA